VLRAVGGEGFVVGGKLGHGGFQAGAMASLRLR
jgi:hypothetical protein